MLHSHQLCRVVVVRPWLVLVQCAHAVPSFVLQPLPLLIQLLLLCFGHVLDFLWYSEVAICWISYLSVRRYWPPVRFRCLGRKWPTIHLEYAYRVEHAFVE